MAQCGGGEELRRRRAWAPTRAPARPGRVLGTPGEYFRDRGVMIHLSRPSRSLTLRMPDPELMGQRALSVSAVSVSALVLPGRIGDWRLDLSPAHRTEIDVARAKFSEIMSWDDWKAKARRLHHPRPECGGPAQQNAQDIPALTGMGDSGATSPDVLAGNWRELCKRS